MWPGKSLPNNIITIAISLEHIPHMLILYIATHVHNYIEPDDHKVSFAHEQKRHGLQWTWSIGVATVANKGTVTVFVMLVGHDNSRHIYAQIFQINYDWFIFFMSCCCSETIIGIEISNKLNLCDDDDRQQIRPCKVRVLFLVPAHMYIKPLCLLLIVRY